MDRSVPPPPASALLIAEAQEPFRELLPEAVLEAMGQQIAWLVTQHPVGVDLMSRVSRSLVVELPRDESEEARTRRGYDAIDRLRATRAEAREAGRREAPGRFFLPDASFRVVITLLASVSGRPLPPDVPRDLVEGLLREMCDALIVAQLLGLLHELDARPRALAEWGEVGAALGAALPRIRAAQRAALAKVPPEGRGMITLFASCDWNMDRIGTALRKDPRRGTVPFSAALRELGMAYRTLATGLDELADEEALGDVALALYADDPSLPPAAPRVEAQVTRATAPYRHLLPAPVVVLMGKTLRFLLESHPVGRGVLTRTAPDALPGAPVQRGHRVGTIPGLAAVNAWAAALNTLRVRGRPKLILPQDTCVALAAFIGYLRDVPPDCWLEVPPRDLPDVAGAFGDAVMAAQLLAMVHRIEATDRATKGWGDTGRAFRESLPHLKEVQRRALAALPEASRRFFDACLACGWELVAVAEALRWDGDWMLAQAPEHFRLLGAAFRAALMTN